MSRSKHQTLKSIVAGQSQQQVEVMFSEQDHDAMEWLEKRKIKASTLKDRRDKKIQANGVLDKNI